MEDLLHTKWDGRLESFCCTATISSFWKRRNTLLPQAENMSSGVFLKIITCVSSVAYNASKLCEASLHLQGEVAGIQVCFPTDFQVICFHLPANH